VSRGVGEAFSSRRVSVDLPARQRLQHR